MPFLVNKDNRKEFLEAAKPLMKWLSDNCHPHCKVVVENNSATLWESDGSVRTDEFLHD